MTSSSSPVEPELSEKLTEQKFIDCLRFMMSLQEAHNREVHISWATQDYEFWRAIWTECAELLDHYGWKWWKHHDRDLEQVKLEIVDIWHFGLSMIMLETRNMDELGKRIIHHYECAERVDFLESVELLAQNALEEKFDVELFVNLLVALPMSLNELYGIYYGKNVLNRFRQAHGYKEGSYRKMWGGKEDNVQLAVIVREMNAFAPGFEAKLQTELESRYLAVLQKPSAID